MNYALTNGIILDGTRQMQPQKGLSVLVKDGKIVDLVPDTTDIFELQINRSARSLPSSRADQYACTSCRKRETAEKTTR